MSSDQIADLIYQDFCESGGVTHPVQDAWNRVQVEFGEIEVGGSIDDLVCEMIKYALDVAPNYIEE